MLLWLIIGGMLLWLFALTAWVISCCGRLNHLDVWMTTVTRTLFRDK